MIAENWPKPLSALPGNEKWTWGAAEGIYAESPNRIYLFQRGELPVITRPKNTPIRAPNSAELRSDGARATSLTPSSLVSLNTCTPAVPPTGFVSLKPKRR